MNALLWVFQIVLALLYFSGGAYKAFSFDQVAAQLTALSRGGWRAVGIFEMLGAVLLIAPAALKWKPLWKPQWTPIVAALLALETFALAALYAQYSLQLAATNPLVWALVMGLLAAFVAYGRYALRPHG
jgi:hypothetical protein